MRNLTIKRKKSFVASLAKMKVYIEDPDAQDLRINGVSCRKLGDLKNGEEKTFAISEQSARVFIIGDKLTKDYSSEFRTIPAGQEDVVLSGGNRYNLLTGNAFQFDGAAEEAVLQHRKKSRKTGLLVLIVAAIVGFAVGFISNWDAFVPKQVEPETFTSNGMTVTLTNEFWEASYEGYTACFDSEKIAVLALQEPFDSFEGLADCTLEEYAQMVFFNNGFDDSITLQQEQGQNFFEYQYQNPDTGEVFGYYTLLYKAEDAFWMVQIAGEQANYDAYRSSFPQWASTISFE